MDTVREPLTAAVPPPPSLRDSEAEDHSRNSTHPGAVPHDEPPNELDAHRCQFTFSDGRQCRMPRAAYHSSLCADHAYKEDGCASSALPELETLCNDLTTSTNINRALAQTCRMLAQGRISQRQAVAFGYLHQLLLQTVPGVRAEYVAAYGYKPWEARLKAAIRPGSPSRATNQSEGSLSDLSTVPGDPPQSPSLSDAQQPSTEVVEREKALRRERHGYQELRGAKEVITALSAENEQPSTGVVEPEKAVAITALFGHKKDYQSILTRARDISDGKYNTTPEGRREMKRFTYELEMMKPPSSKPPKGFVGSVVQFARSVQAGLAPAPPPLALNNLGHPIKPAVWADKSGDPTRIAVPSEQRERGNRVHGKPDEQAISPEPSSAATAPPEPPPFDPNTFAPNYMAKQRSVRAKLRQDSSTEYAAPAPDPAGSAPLKPADRVGHTTDWFAPASWTKPLPDPFPSRRERLRQELRGIGNCRSRRLQH